MKDEKGIMMSRAGASVVLAVVGGDSIVLYGSYPGGKNVVYSPVCH
jgi:hypothetical protein